MISSSPVLPVVASAANCERQEKGGNCAMEATAQRLVVDDLYYRLVGVELSPGSVLRDLGESVQGLSVYTGKWSGTARVFSERRLLTWKSRQERSDEVGFEVPLKSSGKSLSSKVRRNVVRLPVSLMLRSGFGSEAMSTRAMTSPSDSDITTKRRGVCPHKSFVFMLYPTSNYQLCLCSPLLQRRSGARRRRHAPYQWPRKAASCHLSRPCSGEHLSHPRRALTVYSSPRSQADDRAIRPSISLITCARSILRVRRPAIAF